MKATSKIILGSTLAWLFATLNLSPASATDQQAMLEEIEATTPISLRRSDPAAATGNLLVGATPSGRGLYT